MGRAVGDGSEKTGGLTAAAEALETELRHYEDLAASLERERLDSEKNLRRAAQALSALCASEGRLAEHLANLVAAIGNARERQQAHAEAVQTRAARIQERSQALALLLSEWEALGRDAEDVRNLIQRTSGDPGDTNHSPSARAPSFGELEDRLTRLGEEAHRLVEKAQTEHFDDLARQAEGLRAQVLSALNKLRLARGNG